MFTLALTLAPWIDRKLEVNFQTTASTCSEFSSFAVQHKRCPSMPGTWLKNKGSYLERGAMPTSHLPPRANLCIPQHVVGLICPHTPHSSHSSSLWFVSSEVKGDGGSCSILAEVKLLWLSHPQQNPTCFCHTTEWGQPQWLTQTAATLLPTTKNQRIARENSTAARHVQAFQRVTRLVLN